MQWIERIRMKLLIRRLRRNMEWCGYDVSHLTDDELIRRLQLAGHHAARVANEAAVTVEQMGNALKRMAIAYARVVDSNRERGDASC